MLELRDFVEEAATFQRGFTFTSVAARLMGVAAHCTISLVNDEEFKTHSHGGWLNEEEARALGYVRGETRARMISAWKSTELALPPQKSELDPYGIRTTPELTRERGGCGWMGGVRIGKWSVGVSKLNERHDAVFALIAMQSLHDSYCRIHHVGFEHKSQRAYEEAVQERQAMGMQYGHSTNNPTSQLCTYTYAGTDLYGNPLYIQDVFYINGPFRKAAHVDVVCFEPKEFMRRAEVIFQANTYNGSIYVSGGEKDAPIGLTARSHEDVWSPRK